MLFSILALISGCSKPEEFSGTHVFTTSRNSDVHLRERDDPFAIHNIIKAYENLRAGDPSVPVLHIAPNNLYLRFLPENESEFELLRNDTTLTLYDYPLNADISEGEFSGVSAQNSLPYQYCVVPEGKQLPPVKYELIYEVFIPPYRDYEAKSMPGEMTDFYEKLVSESARITGNLSVDDSVYITTRSSSGRWKPKGRIRVWDDVLGMYIPLNHVNVHARWFTRVETALTDSDGYFSMKSFSHKVNYSIKWENSLFDIRDGLLMQAWYNGPKKKGDWMLDIRNGKSKMFATIHRAAYRQFYGNNLGLFRPRLCSGKRTKISYMDGKGTGQFNGSLITGGLIPQIQIWGDNATTETNIIFASVSHELGHQLHSEYIGNLKYMKVSRIIRESWAEAVEWAITNDEYHTLGKKYGVFAAIRYDHQNDKHNGWPLVSDKEYSPAFIDLADSINQGSLFGPDHPNDLISQYSVSYMNYNLLGSTTDISSLKQEVTVHKLDGVDDYKISQLFLLY